MSNDFKVRFAKVNLAVGTLEDSRYVRRDGANSFTATQDANGHQISNLANGAPGSQQAATVAQVETLVSTTRLPAPALVATSNVSLSGHSVIDGVNTSTLAADDYVLLTAQTNPAENGPQKPGAGSWSRPDFYNVDDEAAALLGAALPAVTGGVLGAGSVWAQRTGATIAGSKTFVRLPDAADKAAITCILPSGDTSGATDYARIQAALDAAKAAGGGTVQLAGAGSFYVNDDLECENAQGVYLIGSGGGASGPTKGTRLIRVGGSAFNTGHRSYTQPSVGATVVVTVDSTAGMVVGKRARTRSGPANSIGQTYVITAIGAGTVTLRNDGATGNAAPTTVIAADFLRSDEAIVQMRSMFYGAVRDLQLQAASPTFCGKGVNFDGSPLGNDSAHCDVYDCTIIGAAFSALPALVPLNSSTHPNATLTGACAQCLDLLVDILSSTTYRYSTDGGRTWDESSDTSPITITTSRAFPSTSNAYGLTLNLPAGTYAAGYKYRAQQGIQRGVDLQNCFDCDTWARFDTVLDGVYASGVSNTIYGTALGVDGYLVTLYNAFGAIVDVAAEPGGRGYSRGGIWSDNGIANRYALASGDTLTGGSWIWLQSETSPELKCYLSQAAGAAISLLGCTNVRIRGNFSLSPAYVFDASRTGATTTGVFVEDVNGFTWDGATNTLYSGSNVGFISYFKDSLKSISGANLINAAKAQNGLVCGPGTQALVAGCINVGGQRSIALAWGGNSGAAIEILNPAHGYGDGLGYFPPQNVAAAGHAFLVRDAGAPNGQRNGLFVGVSDVVLGGGLAGGYHLKGLKTVQYDGWVDLGSMGASKTITLTDGALQKGALNSATCTLTINLPVKACGGVLKFTQDATGGRALTWPAGTKFPGGVAQQPATAANAVSYIDWFYDPDLGLQVTTRGAYS